MNMLSGTTDAYSFRSSHSIHPFSKVLAERI